MDTLESRTLFSFAPVVSTPGLASQLVYHDRALYYTTPSGPSGAVLHKYHLKTRAHTVILAPGGVERWDGVSELTASPAGVAFVGQSGSRRSVFAVDDQAAVPLIASKWVRSYTLHLTPGPLGIYFIANAPGAGTEVHASDGTPTGTRVLTDHPENDFVFDLAIQGQTVLTLSNSVAEQTTQLSRSLGTPESTTPIASFVSPSFLGRVGGRTLLQASLPNGKPSYYLSGGSIATTQKIPGDYETEFYSPRGTYDGKFYFGTINDTGRHTLRSYDPITNTSVPVAAFEPGGESVWTPTDALVPLPGRMLQVASGLQVNDVPVPTPFVSDNKPFATTPEPVFTRVLGGAAQVAVSDGRAYLLRNEAGAVQRLDRVAPQKTTFIGPAGGFAAAGGEVYVLRSEAIYRIDNRVGVLTGRVWQDVDLNRVFSRNRDVGLSDVTVFIDQNNNGTLDRREPRTQTLVGGEYFFGGMAAGTYTVRALLPHARMAAVSPMMANVEVTAGRGTVMDFGMRLSIPALAGYVYRDDNADGKRNAGEPRVSYASVRLQSRVDAPSGAFWGDYYTPAYADEYGSFVFSELPPGSYRVVAGASYDQKTLTTNSFIATLSSPDDYGFQAIGLRRA